MSPKTEVSESDVQKSRAVVDKLREELAETQDKLAVSEAGRTNYVRKAALDNEAENLRAQVAAAKEALKLSQSKSGDRVLDQIEHGGAFEEPSGLLAETETKEG